MQLGRNSKARGENSSMKEHLHRIPSLANILKGKVVALDKNMVDTPGFMLYSRYIKNETAEGPKVKEKMQRVVATDEEGGDHIQLKSQEPATNAGSNTDKKKRFALSLATLAAKKDKRITIVNEGAIAVLIDLATSHDKSIQIRCSSAFASLSLEPSIRARMLDEGALASIISLATNSNAREVKFDCVRAICNLCCTKGYEFKMVKEGVPFVVTHVAASCPDAVEVCMKVLLNITCVTDKFARIEDITEALMFFATSNVALTYEMELIMLTAFRNLAGLRNNQLRLVEDGCLKIVDRFLKSSHSKFRKIACEVLKSLTMDWKTHSKLMEQNILSLLLQMYHDKDEDVRIICVKSFLYLAEDEKFRRQIVEGPALSHLLNVSNSKLQHVEMCQLTAKTLRLLCGDRNVAHELVQNGVGHALITLLGCADDLIQQFCAEALCGLFQVCEILELLVDQGAAQELVNLTYRTSNPHTCEWCSFALYQLSKGNIKEGPTHSPRAAHASYESILPCIIYLCELDYSTHITKRFCSAAFANATLSKVIDCSGAIPLLVKMLRDEDNQTIKKYCASSLFNLADSVDNCYKMLDAHALSPVVELTLSDYTTRDSDPKVICAGIISRLSLHKQYYDQFAQGNVLKVLLELSCVDHRLTQRRVVIALSNLSQNEELKQKLLALKPIPYIISLAAERDEYLRRGCISIVCNMSYVPGSERAIVQAGIVPTLMITSMITSDQIASKVICVKALINLMADRSQLRSMVRDGIIWGLSKLAQMLDLCAKALCRLSCEHAREMLSSQVAVRTLMTLINNSDLGLMQSGARMLTNVLLHTNQTDADFHRQVVKSMLPLARSHDKELNELCVICLCLASQSESCRSFIVSSGMLQMIDSSTIFSDITVSYAYITMFGNIANNPAMRSRVLDDRLLERFEGICETKMYSLHLAVARALYCLSCSAENIPKLVQQRIVPMIRSLAQTQYTESRADLLSHLIATCYNLSTVVDIQHKLVSQGFVGVMLTLWPDAKQDKDLCLLSYLSICHLACGRTNTTQMAQDGCTSILCFISEYRKNPNLGNYNFTVDVHYRCSSALRNLLSVVSNQKAMVDQGCLASIIDLANFSSKDKDKAFNGDPQSNFTGIWRNCAVSLTSLTYNVEVREQLVKSEAINLILRNADEDRGEFNLSHGLLRELEAESWHNGARGKHKEGRSKILKPSTLYTELLRGGTTVHLDVVVQDAELDKFCVQVQLDEPQAHTDTDLSDPAATAPDEAAEARDKELQLDVLQPYVDLDDGFSSLAYTVEKQECALNTDSAFALYRGEDGLDEFESTTLTEDILAEPSAALPIPNNNLPGPHLDDGMGMGMGSPSEKSTLPQMGALGQLFFNNVKTVLAVMPPKESSDPFPPLVSPVKAKREVTRSPSVGKLQSAKQSPKNEQFKAIIGMIKEAKEGKSSMDDVMHKWGKISKF
mmetsp:Transcript_28225/g.62516  ORF Transcript_28225/g.62516 Transcript_28225/m.62516 type:complete len:1451 (+) Transcript_28225:122-4474(+)